MPKRLLSKRISLEVAPTRAPLALKVTAISTLSPAKPSPTPTVVDGCAQATTAPTRLAAAKAIIGNASVIAALLLFPVLQIRPVQQPEAPREPPANRRSTTESIARISLPDTRAGSGQQRC
jgi:hypothetical protein